MTVEMCFSTCRSKGFAYSGLQWQIECYCGNEPKKAFEWAWPDKCSQKCAGNSNQVCGGSTAISIYSNPMEIDGSCIYDFPSPNRVLNGYLFTGDNNMTIEKCKEICTGMSRSQTFIGNQHFTLKVFNTLDSKMEMNVIAGIVPRDFNQHILLSVTNAAMEMNLSFVVIIGA